MKTISGGKWLVGIAVMVIAVIGILLLQQAQPKKPGERFREAIRKIEKSRSRSRSRSKKIVNLLNKTSKTKLLRTKKTHQLTIRLIRKAQEILPRKTNNRNLAMARDRMTKQRSKTARVKGRRKVKAGTNPSKRRKEKMGKRPAMPLLTIRRTKPA